MVLKPNAVVDIAKPGPQLQNLTGMWNARVLDGFTPFVVQFKENGLPVNLTGLNAFIEGDIGEGHYDSATDDIVMTGTPKSVRYTDDGSGNTNLGIVVFRLPPQFFIQTGIFKGFIGLQSSTGIRSTSNDVWFKVLGNSYTMGISCKYFISDFQKALDQADGKITQALNDLKNRYDREVSEHENALIDDTKNLKDLAAQVGAIQAQITSNDIVKTADFNRIINDTNNRIDNRLARISSETPFFETLDDLKKKYPNGAEGLFRVGDHGYMFKNSQWLDVGELPSSAIADSDFNEREGIFFINENKSLIKIDESKDESTGLWAGILHIPNGTILYLGNHGDFYKFDKETDVGFGYYPKDIEEKGFAAFYFDGINKIYADFKPTRRNDVKIFNIYNGHIFCGSTNGIIVNGVANGGWENNLGSIMAINDGKRINVIQKDGYKVNIPIGMNVYTTNGNHFNNVEAQNLSIQAELPNLYFDLLKKEFYLSTEIRKTSDLFIASFYQNHVYSSDVEAFIIDGVDKGGWGKANSLAYLMFLPLFGNQPIQVEFTSSKTGLHYKIDIPKNTLALDMNSNKIALKASTIEADAFNTALLKLFVKRDGTEYLSSTSQSSDDYLVCSFFNRFAYGVNVQNIVVNGINNGGWGKSNRHAYLMQLNDGKYLNVNALDKNSTIDIPIGMNFIKENGQVITNSHAQTLNYNDYNKIINLFYDELTDNFYLDELGHKSDDFLITTLYENHAYGVNVQNIVVNGKKNGGFGNLWAPKLDLNDWRIKADKSEPANIAWLGDSTYQGYKTSGTDKIAGNYLNKLLPNDYTGVTSYVCAIGGYTTWDLYNHFDDLIKLNNSKNIGLVLIGGGLNDSGNIADEQKYLDLVVKRVRMLGATPVIVTTQATALLNTNKSQGDDWTGKRNSDYARTNQIRREYARMHDIDIIDLEKYQNAYVEYGPAKLTDMFDDYLHGHDDMHKFGAEFVFSQLAQDRIDLIENSKVVSVTTMKAKSDLFAYKTNMQLIDTNLNAKGFKASMKNDSVTTDTTVIDYQFFIPAGEKKYYLNGYNLGDAVSVSLNGDITQLNGTQQISELDPGYYHVIVKPTTSSINFVGLRIENNIVGD